MGEKLNYAAGYYDAVINHLMEENIPKNKTDVLDQIRCISDGSSCFEDAIFELGAEVLADKVMRGE